jgi:hypothetical protein
MSVVFRCCFLFLTMISLSLSAQKNYTISGNVIDPAGKHTSYVSIGLFQDQKLVQVKLSDSIGGFHFLLLPGSYTLSAQTIGYKPYRNNLMITDHDTSVTISLKSESMQLSEVNVVARKPLI